MSLNVQPMNSEVESALLTVLQLQQQARNAENLNALHFVILNQTRGLVDYDQAILWDARQQSVCGASGVMSVDKQAPLMQWVHRQSQVMAKSEQAVEIHRVDPSHWSTDEQAEASEYLLSELVWIPLLDRKKQLIAGLWLSRKQGLSIREKRLLSFTAESYGFVWQSLLHQKPQHVGFTLRRRRMAVVSVLLLVAAMFLPVRQSVLAPAEVVSAHTLTVRMPVDGLIEKMWVKPNSSVKKGQALFELDSQQLNDQLAQAQQQLSIANAELRLARQQSFYDASRKASVSVLEGKRNLASSQVHYLQQKVAQTTVVAKQDGIALFDDQGDWVGRPLRLGEPVMDIADPNKTEVEVRLAVDDRMNLASGDDVRLFLNSRPTEPVDAALTTVAYRSTLQDDGHYAFVLKAKIQPSESLPEMGLKGLAKVYGENTSLFYYLFRRPLSHVRLWWGSL